MVRQHVGSECNSIYAIQCGRVDFCKTILKGEGHSKKRIFFVNANNNLALSLVTHRSFSFESAGFPCKIRLQIRTSLLPF